MSLISPIVQPQSLGDSRSGDKDTIISGGDLNASIYYEKQTHGLSFLTLANPGCALAHLNECA